LVDGQVKLSFAKKEAATTAGADGNTEIMALTPDPTLITAANVRCTSSALVPPL
jgi:hypothetical protein